MKIIKPSVEEFVQSAGFEGMLKHIERCGRLCYKSEDKITKGSAEKFVEMLKKHSHGSMLEHGTIYLTVPGNDVRDMVAREGSSSDNTNHWLFFLRNLPYSKCVYKNDNYYITTNYRVIIENELVELMEKYATEPTCFHEKRRTFYMVCDRACYDKDTYVLTNEGWKLFSDLNHNEKFATLNDSGELVYVDAIDYIEYNYNGEMHLWKDSTINLCVTPNHNMWLYDYHKRSKETKIWKFIKSEDAVNNRYKINRSTNGIKNDSINNYTIPSVKRSNKIYKSLTFDANLFFELVGLWLTDGSINFQKTSGDRCVITQKKENIRDRIEFLLKSLKINYNKSDVGFRINCPQLLNWLNLNFLKPGDTHKTYYLKLPSWIYNSLDTPNIKSLLKGIIEGDGTPTTKGNGYQVYTASKSFAEDIVTLSVISGFSANIRTQKERIRKFPNGYVSNCKKQYIVQISTVKEHLFTAKNKKSINKTKIDYNDNVYCVTLSKYNKLFVMRDGKACWCGNCSHEYVRHRVSSFAQESQRYVAYDKEKYGSEIKFIEPLFFEKDTLPYAVWMKSCSDAETAYMTLRSKGATAQEARTVLPNSTATGLIMTQFESDWTHFFYLRCAKDAHPQAQEVANMIRRIYFCDISLNFCNGCPKFEARKKVALAQSDSAFDVAVDMQDFALDCQKTCDRIGVNKDE